MLEQPSGGWNSADYRSGGGGSPYPNEPNYVKHLWVDCNSVDHELYWESDDFGEPNTISGGIGVAEMIRFDDVGPGLAVAGTYNTDGKYTARISLYKRIAPQGDHQYRFEEIKRIMINDTELKGIEAINLDGNSANLNESFITVGRTLVPETAEYTARVFCVEPNNVGEVNDAYELTELYVDNEDCYPYTNPYSNTAVLDRNGDGFDDFVLMMMKEGETKSDLLYFKNIADNNDLFGGARFAYSPGHYEILIENYAIEQTLDFGDVDDDEIDELITGFSLRYPPDDPNGTYKTVFYNIFEENFKPVSYPGDFDDDGNVDFLDFALLANHWLCTGGLQCWDPLYDISCPTDDKIDLMDLKRFVDYWLKDMEE